MRRSSTLLNTDLIKVKRSGLFNLTRLVHIQPTFDLKKWQLPMIGPNCSPMNRNLLALEASPSLGTLGENTTDPACKCPARCLSCSRPKPQKSPRPCIPHPSGKVLVGIKGKRCFWNTSSFRPFGQVLPSHPSLRTFSKIQQKMKNTNKYLLSIGGASLGPGVARTRSCDPPGQPQEASAPRFPEKELLRDRKRHA